MMIKFQKIFSCVNLFMIHHVRRSFCIGVSFGVGLLFFNTASLFSGVNFSSKDSKISVNNNANLGIRNEISNWTGALDKKTGATVSGSTITFDDGIFTEEGVGNRLSATYSSDETIKLFLGGNKTFKTTSGTSLNKINVFGSGNRIEGQPIFSNTDSIRLEHQNTNLTIAVQSNLNSDIEMRGGKVNLDNDLKFTEDRIFTGSGTVDLQGYGLSFGSKTDLNLTHTIDWQNATDINLTGKTDLSGLWTFNGPGIVNGHGNILDMGTGGEIYLKHQASLELTNIIVRGIGTDKGNIIFQDNTATLSTSNLHFDFDDSFSMTIGKMYVDGPTTISGFFSSSRTIDLQNDLFLSGNMTLSCGQGISGNGNTINLLGNLNIQENTPLHFMSDTLVEGNGNTIVLGNNAQLFVDTDVSVTLRNVNIKNSKNYLAASPIKLAASSSQLTLDNAKLSFVDDYYFDRGQIYFYNDVDFTGTNAFIYRSPQKSYIEAGGKLKFDVASTLSFAPATFTDCPYSVLSTYTSNNFIEMIDSTSVLEFDGCTFKTTLTGLRLTKGSVFLNNRVEFDSSTSVSLDSLTSVVTEDLGDSGRGIAWSPDGRYLAVGSSLAGNELQVFSFDGASLTVLPACTKSFSAFVWTVSWSPDGKYLAIGGRDAAGFIFVYYFNGTSLTELPYCSLAFGAYSYALKWSPDGKYLAIGGNNGSEDLKVFFFDGFSLKELFGCTKDFVGSVYDLAWSPSGDYLVAGGSNGSEDLKVYAFNGITLIELSACSKDFSVGVYGLSWSPDGRYIAVGGSDDAGDLKVYIFNGISLNELLGCTKYVASSVSKLSWSPDGRYIAVPANNNSEDLMVYIFDGLSLGGISGCTKPFGSSAHAISWRADQKYLAVNGSNTPNDLVVYETGFILDPDQQAFSNSIVLGNSSLGLDYDVNLKLLSGAYVEVDGMLNYDNTLGLTVFSNDNAKLVLKDSNSYIRLNPVNVFGWKDRSLLKNITGVGIGDYNLLTYDVSANDIISYAEAPADFIYYNSNAIVTFQDNYSELIESNSNAILHLEDQVENNSNAIVYLEDQVENNSNAIMWQDVQIKDNSNSILNLEPQLENNSNAILNLEPQIENNSNAIKNLEVQIKDNSNAVDSLAPFVRWNSNAIESEADLEIYVRTNSNAILNLEEQIKENSNAIVENEDQIRWNSSAILSLLGENDWIRYNSNAILSAIKIYDTTQTYAADTTLENLVLYKNGFTVNTGKTLILNTPLSISGPITLSGTLNLGGDLYLNSDATFPSGGVIDGNGNTIFLGGDLEIPDDVDLRFTDSTIINGQGNNLILGHRAQLLIDTLTTLTLKNLTLKNSLNNVARPAVKCLDMYGKLALDNATLAFKDDFYFNKGQLFIHNDVVVSGSSGLIYRSTQPSFITSGASLTFDIGTTFSYDTVTTSSYLINLVDESSSLYLNGCSLKCTTTGLNLTRGRLFLDNKVLFRNNEIEDLSSLTVTTSVHYGLRAYSVQWSPDNKYLAVGGQNDPKDFTVYGWNGSTLEYLTHVNTGAYLLSVDWTSDGKYFVVGGSGIKDVYVYSWDGTNLVEKQSLEHGIVYDARWSPDNKFLAIGCDEDYNEILIYSWVGEALTLTTSQHFGTDVKSVSWHPSGNYIAVGGNYSDTDLILYGFDGSNLSFIQAEPHALGAASLEWSSDGNHLAILGSSSGLDGLIIYKFSNNYLENVASDLGSGGRDVTWSANNKYLAVSGAFAGASDIYIYEFTGDSLQTTTDKLYGYGANSVDWDADSRYLAVAGEYDDNDVTVYLVGYEHVAASPAVDNSIIFGRNESGSSYDLNARLLGGAFVEVDGILNIDNTLTTSIFDNDVSKFVLKDSDSKIKFAASNVNGFIDRSIMKQIYGRGFGDYNLLNYDTGADDIISYSEAPADLLISNSNAIINLEPQIKDNSNAIKTIESGDVATDIRANSNSAVSLEVGRIGKFLSVNNGILSAIGAITGETIIQGRGILSSPINLNGATLTNGGDILFSSGTTIESSGNLNPIGHAYILGGDINLPENVDLKFTTSGIIDGQGHSWTFGHNSKIKFDEYITVTFRNIKLNNVRSHSDGNASITVLNPWRSKLVLENSEINMSDNFSFTSGELFLHGDVKICGTTQFNYTSTSFARITNASQWYFDQGVTFSYGPSITDNRDLIHMEDATSALYLNGCTLKSTTTGLRLKTGKLIIDGKIIAYNEDDKNGAATSLSQAISFGDGITNLDVEIMSAANIEMMSGILDVN